MTLLVAASPNLEIFIGLCFLAGLALGGLLPIALAYNTERALSRVWRAQHFSYWVTTMLHRAPEAAGFGEHRQLGELSTRVVRGRLHVPGRGLHGLARVSRLRA